MIEDPDGTPVVGQDDPGLGENNQGGEADRDVPGTSTPEHKLLQDPEVLRSRRLVRGLEQTELAQRAGCTQAAVSRLERGNRSARLSTLRKLAVALECEVKDLIAPHHRRKAS
ncbi:hypothetical protein GCM10023196_037670 [Actinoallomurus vinaceus]|uniref:HTH cro/C1-type domain-containing protein n=1 Tax=Actinoallomurus vinaceus TaxID=1080074 RepID=A0ABP8UD37_9ACTN